MQRLFCQCGDLTSSVLTSQQLQYACHSKQITLIMLTGTKLIRWQRLRVSPCLFILCQIVVNILLELLLVNRDVISYIFSYCMMFIIDVLCAVEKFVMLLVWRRLNGRTFAKKCSIRSLN